MELMSIELEKNEVIVTIMSKRQIIFRESGRIKAMKRYTKMLEHLPTLLEDAVLSGAFEPLDEKDIL